MVTVEEADRLLQAQIRRGDSVSIPLTDATGRILREDVAADRDHPPFDRVAMDGIAIQHSAWAEGRTRFRVQGVQRAGGPPLTLSAADGCLEVMTGAVLPDGCDTVIRYEDVHLSEGETILADGLAPTARQNVHHRATDRKAADIILESGTRLRPTHIAALASEGKATVQVARIPRIVVFSTGDELVDVHEPVLPHQIRRSNAYAIRAALTAGALGEVTLVHARDDGGELRTRMTEALATADVLILSGGVSMGRFDLVPQILGELGVANVFHKVRHKPGKPLWFGVTSDGRPVFGLPGNPVAVMVCLYRYVLPWLEASAGMRPVPPRRVVLQKAPHRKNDFTHFVPVYLAGEEDRDAVPVSSSGSADFLALLATDGFVEVGPEDGPGSLVRFFPWSLS